VTAQPPSGPLTPPEGRYGPPGRSMPRFLPLVLIVAALVAVIPLTVAVYDRMNPAVTADVLGWDITENEVTVRLQVEKPSGSGARCDLEAYDVGGEVVGTRGLEVPATDDRTTVGVEETFPTAREAVTVKALRCDEVERD
jgi:hypothetical protein